MRPSHQWWIDPPRVPSVRLGGGLRSRREGWSEIVKFIYTSRSLSSRQCFQTNSFQNRWLGLLFAGVWLGASSPAIATDIYVDARHDLEKFGQDGTKEFPYKHITSALESVNPEEDTVVHIVGDEGDRMPHEEQ